MSNFPDTKNHVPNVTEVNTALVQPPQPGSYHRLTREYDVMIEEKARKTYDWKVQYWEEQLQRIKESKVAGQEHLHQQPRHEYTDPGEYKPPTPLAGTVLMVSKVMEVEGEFHSANVEGHPSGHVDGFTVNAVGFREFFEPAEDWQEVRAAELAEKQRQLVRSQNDMAEGPKREEVDPEPEAPMTALTQGSSSSFAIAIREGGRETIERTAKRHIAVAKATETWLVSKSTEITQIIGQVAAFHKENAVAQIAKTQRIQEEVARLQRGVESLGIYSGDDVEVVHIRRGASAPEEIPLFLFQRKLFMDEEFLIDIMLDGADWEDMEAFLTRLREDDEFRDLMTPFPRGVVLFQVRNKDIDYKKHLKNIDYQAWAMMNKNANIPNHRCFLLIRDGENLCQAWIPDILGSPSRLFPKTKELEKPFRGFDGETLTFDDLQYHKASQKADDVDLFYRRLLVLMAGLDTRLGVFGKFYDPSKYPSTAMMCLDLQRERMLFVHDDDSKIIGDDRVVWKTWIPKMNAYLRNGSIVLCDWERLIDESTAPQAMIVDRQDRHEAQHKYRYPERFQVRTCKINADGNAIVKATVKKYSEEATFETEVRLNMANGGEIGYLVLDAVEAKDVETILRSRSHRSEYIEYVPMLSVARKAVAEQETISEESQRQLVRKMSEASIGSSETEREQIAQRAVRLWRGEHEGRAPKTTEKDAAKTKNDLARVAYRLAKPDTDIDSIKDSIRAEGRKPHAIVMRGDGNVYAYAAERKGENTHILPWRWVLKSVISFEKNGEVSIEGWSDSVLPIADSGETVLWQDDNAEDLRDVAYSKDTAEGNPKLSLKRAKKIESGIKNGENLAKKYFSDDIDVTALFETINRKNVWSKAKNSWSTQYLKSTPSLVLPVGILSVSPQYIDPSSTESEMYSRRKSWKDLTDNEKAERLEEAKKKASIQIHHVIVLEWNPTAATASSTKYRNVGKKYWEKTVTKSDYYDSLVRSKPKLVCYGLLEAPIFENGLTNEDTYSYESLVIGANHLDGKDFTFEKWSYSGFRTRYGNNKSMTGRTIVMDDAIATWAQENIGFVDLEEKKRNR